MDLWLFDQTIAGHRREYHQDGIGPLAEQLTELAQFVGDSMRYPGRELRWHVEVNLVSGGWRHPKISLETQNQQLPGEVVAATELEGFLSTFFEQVVARGAAPVAFKGDNGRRQGFYITSEEARKISGDAHPS